MTPPKYVIPPRRRKTVVGVLTAARNLLADDNGVTWCKYESIKGTPGKISVCAYGALATVVHGVVEHDLKGLNFPFGSSPDEKLHLSTESLQVLSVASMALNGETIIRYNDTPGVRKRDIIKTFDKAIDLAKKEKK